MRKFKILFTTILLSVGLSCTAVYASEQPDASQMEEDTSATNGDYDFLKDEVMTESFYIPKSRFMSDYDYERYCQDMYNRGYMNELYEWTPAAKEYINDMTPETSKILDEDARAIVKERIENGDMEPEDNPYLTYDEKQALIKEKEADAASPSESPSVTTTETPGQDEQVSITPTEIPDESSDETQDNQSDDIDNQNELHEETKPNVMKVVIMGLIIIIVVVVGVYIYKRQF